MVNQVKAVKITVNSSASLISSTNQVVLKNNPVGGGGVTRLDKLADVDASTETDKATLVYNASLDKYVVKQLDIDGGTF
jgi:hypothetical protein